MKRIYTLIAGLVLGLSMLFPGPGAIFSAGTVAPDAGIIDQENLIRREAEDKIQKDILDRILGEGRASVLVNVEVSLETENRESGTSEGKVEDRKGLGDQDYILPWVPAQKSVSKNNEVAKDAKMESASGEIASSAVRQLVRRFDVTVIHDENVGKQQLDLVDGSIRSAYDRYEKVMRVIYKSTRFAKYEMKVKIREGFWDFLKPQYLLPGLIALLLKLGKPHKGILTLTAGALLLLGAVSSMIEMLGLRFNPATFDGGWLGYALEGVLAKMFGKLGAALFSGVIFFAGLQLLFKISWRRVFKAVYQTIAADYRDWSAARTQLKAKLKIIADKEEAGAPVIEAQPIPEPPPQVKELPAAAPELEIVRTPSEAPARKEKDSKHPEQKARPETAKLPARPRDDYFKNFKLPTPDLLDKPADQGFIGPTDEEIASSKLLLESTFKSFNIAVNVSSVQPGPVITRFEVKPAPGVKISSIVSLSNDVALALKSTGAIRVIAPIPGKDAIGFEIPNVKRAKVCLREILESSALNEKKAPLVFGLGR